MAEFNVTVLTDLADEWANIGRSWKATAGKDALRLREKTLGRARTMYDAIEAYQELQRELEELQRLCVELSERLDATAPLASA